jgi:CubicO group peptidase (beta-lactamase class C family)
MTTLVLAPLGLSDTAYAHPVGSDVAASSAGDSIEMRMVKTGVPYPVPFAVADFAGWRRKTVIGDVNDGNAFHALGGVSGHAGLFSTVGDLLALAGALAATPDDETFLSSAVRREFFAEGPDRGQALGFRRYLMPGAGGEREVVGHPGFTGTVVGWLPAEGTAIVLATNRLHVGGLSLANERMWEFALDRVGALLDHSPE